MKLYIQCSKQLKPTYNVWKVLEAMNWPRPTFQDKGKKYYSLKWWRWDGGYPGDSMNPESDLNRIFELTGIQCKIGWTTAGIPRLLVPIAINPSDFIAEHKQDIINKYFTSSARRACEHEMLKLLHDYGVEITSDVNQLVKEAFANVGNN